MNYEEETKVEEAKQETIVQENINQNLNNQNQINLTQGTLEIQPKKNNIVIIVIVILVVVAATGLFIYSKMNNNKTNENILNYINENLQEYDLEIEPTVVYDQNGIKVTMDSSERGESYNSKYTKVNFTISNNSKEEIIPIIGARLYLNNIQIFSLGGGSCGLYLQPGEQRSNCYIKISDRYLDENFISKKIETIRIPIEIIGLQYENGSIGFEPEIKTKNYGKGNQKYTFGKKVFEDDKIELQYVSVDDNGPDSVSNGAKNYDKKILFFMKNKSNKKIKTYLAGSIFVNDEEYDGTGIDTNIVENGYAFVDGYVKYGKDKSTINKIKFNIEYIDPVTFDKINISKDCEFEIN